MALVNEHFFPGAAEATHTPAFGGPVPYFADFGLIGVIVYSFFNFQLIFSNIYIISNKLPTSLRTGY